MAGMSGPARTEIPDGATFASSALLTRMRLA